MEHPFPSFKNPPLNEVTIGIRFEPLDRFLIPHIGLFWDRIRRDFPNIEHAQPLISKDQIPIDPSTGLPIPRIWFIDQTDTQLIQLQQNLYHFNWRFREGAGSYPRFPEIAKKFFTYLDVLETLFSDTDIGLIKPQSVELTYINLLERGREWNSPEDLPRIFRDFLWEERGDRFLPRPTKLNWSASIPLPNESGTLSVKHNHAKLIQGDREVIQFELTASHQLTDSSRKSIETWYELAHEWIVKGFTDLTRDEIQTKCWGREK